MGFTNFPISTRREKTMIDCQQRIEKVQALLNSMVEDPQTGVLVSIQRDGNRQSGENYIVVNQFVVTVRTERTERRRCVSIPENSLVPRSMIPDGDDGETRATLYIFAYRPGNALANIASIEVEADGDDLFPDFHMEGEDCIDAGFNGKRLLRLQFKGASTLLAEGAAFSRLGDFLQEGSGLRVVLHSSFTGWGFCNRIVAALRRRGLLRDNLGYNHMLCNFGNITLLNGNMLKLEGMASRADGAATAAVLLFLPRDNSSCTSLIDSYGSLGVPCEKFALN